MANSGIHSNTATFQSEDQILAKAKMIEASKDIQQTESKPKAEKGIRQESIEIIVAALIQDRLQDAGDDLPARSLILKDALKAQRFLDKLWVQEKDALNYSKEQVFPRKWMKGNKAIKSVIDSHPAFIDIANYLFNRNRYYRGDDLQMMVDRADSLMREPRRYLEQHIFSTFFTDKAFYQDVTTKLGVSRYYIQNHLAAFAKIGIIKVLWDGKTRGKLYADGYFIQSPDNKHRKISFLRNDPVIIKGLKGLPEILKNYGRKENLVPNSATKF